MKKIFIIIFTFIFLGIFLASSSAASPTPTKKLTPTITPKDAEVSQDQDRIEKIKDLVASKVAELKLVEKRAILGTVKSTTNTQIALEDHRKQQRIIDIDELTKFQTSGKDKSFGISDIRNGDTLGVIGLYNRDTKRLLARFVSEVSSVPENIEGAVIAEDAGKFNLTIVTSEGREQIIDVQTSTRTSSYNKGDTNKSGFSKVEIGQRVIVVGFKDPKEKDRINASRIIHFLSIPISSQMKKFSEASQEVPASTGSAGKVVPIIKGR